MGFLGLDWGYPFSLVVFTLIFFAEECYLADFFFSSFLLSWSLSLVFFFVLREVGFHGDLLCFWFVGVVALKKLAIEFFCWLWS